MNATLQARFSRGLPWQIEVVTYEEPVLSDATGGTDAFTIPTQYKGDVLATTEARYGDGSYAGQTNWTPYQEFNESFRPDYPNNTIILPRKFLDSLRDGELVTLTFHFLQRQEGHVARQEVRRLGHRHSRPAHLLTGRLLALVAPSPATRAHVFPGSLAPPSAEPCSSGR